MTLRIAVVLVAVVAAVLAQPWHTVNERWVLGIAVALVVLALAWWRGLFLTTMVGRRLAVFRRNHSTPSPQRSHRVSYLLEVNDPAGVGLSLPLVAGYVERFGVRCDKVRVTSHDYGDVRRTWLGLTVDAGPNLAALRARSSDLPLYDTAEVVGRRLADHLRETGLQATLTDDADAPGHGRGRETWAGVRDEQGFTAVFGVPVDGRLRERLAEVWAQADETWTALEFSGTSDRPTVAAVVALRSPQRPSRAPLAGLTSHRGRQGPVLTSLDPRSPDRLAVPVRPLSAAAVERVEWPVGVHEGFVELSHS